jgi:integral membrane protein
MLDKYYRMKPFTEAEAWTLFKIAAATEAVGWSLLITGIILKSVIGSNIPVLIAGQIHGMLFLIYILAAIGLGPSLSWSLKKSLTAGLFSIPPYGSLVYEIYAARQRRRQDLKFLLHNLLLRRPVTGSMVFDNVLE